MKALFCQHEGYFGALGCLLELMKTHRSHPPSPCVHHKVTSLANQGREMPSQTSQSSQTSHHRDDDDEEDDSGEK